MRVKYMRVKIKNKLEKMGKIEIDKLRLGMPFSDNIILTVREGKKKQGLNFNVQGLCLVATRINKAWQDVKILLKRERS